MIHQPKVEEQSSLVSQILQDYPTAKITIVIPPWGGIPIDPSRDASLVLWNHSLRSSRCGIAQQSVGHGHIEDTLNYSDEIQLNFPNINWDLKFQPGYHSRFIVLSWPWQPVNRPTTRLLGWTERRAKIC